MVRKNPLPAGRYWLDVPKSARDIWDLFLKKNADVVTVEKKEAEGEIPGISYAPIANFIFIVKEPVIWPRGVGYPNTADATVKSKADTATRPPVPTVKDVITDIKEAATESWSTFTTLAVVAGIAWLYFSSRRR